MPLVSVLMPVYNGGIFLKESIDSILRQSYRELELIIINDGSEDDSESTVLSYNDGRLQYVKQERQGIVKTLNKGLSLCRGEYIARMDADDIAEKSRIEKQVDFLQTHPQVQVVGAYINIFGNGKALVKKYPLSAKAINWAMLRSNAMAHPAVLFRKTLVAGDYYYKEAFHPSEDYELWCRLCLTHAFANIPEVLLQYRVHHAQVSMQMHAEQALTKKEIRKEYIATLFDTKNEHRINELYHFLVEPGRFNIGKSIFFIPFFLLLVIKNKHLSVWDAIGYLKDLMNALIKRM